MERNELEKLYTVLTKNDYPAIYLNIELVDKEFTGIHISERLTKEEKDQLNKLFKDKLDFFELRNYEEDTLDGLEYIITSIGRKVIVNFEGTFILMKKELIITDEEEFDIIDYGFIDDLDEWFD